MVVANENLWPLNLYRWGLWILLPLLMLLSACCYLCLFLISVIGYLAYSFRLRTKSLLSCTPRKISSYQFGLCFLICLWPHCVLCVPGLLDGPLIPSPTPRYTLHYFPIMSWKIDSRGCKLCVHLVAKVYLPKQGFFFIVCAPWDDGFQTPSSLIPGAWPGLRVVLSSPPA